jgi:small subunit ribosomal protein S8
MNMTDPIADMITRIRNGVRAKLQKVDVPSSKLKSEIARILKDEGYISNFKVTTDDKQGVLRVYLKYGPGMERVITDLQRVSRPGCRIYCGKGEIPRVYGGLGINVLSTSRGLMTGKSAAREGVGGEILFNVWQGAKAQCLASEESPSPSRRT